MPRDKVALLINSCAKKPKPRRVTPSAPRPAQRSEHIDDALMATKRRRVAFGDVWLERAALLDKHCDVFSAPTVSSSLNRKQGRTARGGPLRGVYVEREGGAPRGKRRLTNMDRIGQRLFTGRVAVAQGAHEFRALLFRRTRGATDAKPCWVPADKTKPASERASTQHRSLSDVPQLRKLYAEEERRSSRTRAFLEAVESALCASLAARRRPEASLVEAVAAAKVRAVDEAIEMTHRLRQEVGSYALMAGTGFEHTDFLQCCKFAEGDSRVLMMKMARDRVGALTKKNRGAGAGETAASIFASRREAEAAAALAEALKAAASRGSSPAEAWDEVSESAYALAAIAIEEIVQKWLEPRAKL